MTLSSYDMRGTADLTMAFTLPATTDTVTAASDFVAVTLPYQWGGVIAWADGTGTATVALNLVTTTVTGTVSSTKKTAVAGKVTQLSGCTVVFALDAKATKLAEGSSYELVLSGVPTTESKAGADAMMLGSVVLSVGKVASGGAGYSSAMMMPALKAMTVETGKNLLEFEAASATVSRGTYSKGAVCIKPASGNFKADVGVVLKDGSSFKIHPEKL
jgi:hypothetical protein